MVDVPFIASLIHPLSTTNFVLVLIAALLLGPGIPLALLYAAEVAGEQDSTDTATGRTHSGRGER